MEPRKAVTRVVPPAEDSASKKGQQQQQSGPTVLSAEAYTTGGVRKKKFEPKVPARRLKKPSVNQKDEPGEGSGEIPKELQKLLQQAETDGQRAFRPNQRTSKVAFGFGGFSSGTSAPSAGFRHKGSSGGGAGHGSGKGGGGGGGGGGSSRAFEKQEFMQADELQSKHRTSGKNVEVFDLERYFPVTLPLRKPFSGESHLLHDAEFDHPEDEIHEDDEDAVEPAEELGLTENREDDVLFFFQLPQGLPLSSQSKSTTAGSASAKLEDLTQGGAMGKLLVYESGAVKFKVGDVILDALPGTECTFAQELAAVNTTTKRCGFLGEVYKRVVLTPDIDNALPDITNLNT